MIVKFFPLTNTSHAQTKVVVINVRVIMRPVIATVSLFFSILVVIIVLLVINVISVASLFLTYVNVIIVVVVLALTVALNK
jgi:hypothetical protein